MIVMLACLLAAAIVGFAAHRGGTCGVMAVRHWFERRDATLAAGFVVATGAATMVCLPLAWLLERGDQLPGAVPIGVALLGGAVLLGMGAVLNGACLMGSLWRMGNGEVHLLGLPVGIVIGDIVGRALGLKVMVPPSHFAHPDGAGLALIAGGATLLLVATRWLRTHGTDARRLAPVMASMGAAGSLLFVVMPGWTWVNVVDGQVDGLLGSMRNADGPAVRIMMATLAGALASGWLTGQLHLKWRGWRAGARSIGGGAVMMIGIGLIPGGNDSLLLGAAPAGSGSAVFAFAVMNISIAAVLMGGRIIRPNRSEAPPARH